MRSLTNNGRLLCSPGTSFAPLGLNDTNTQTHTHTHTHTHTDGHGNSMTDSAQWGRFSENLKKVMRNLLLYSSCRPCRHFVSCLFVYPDKKTGLPQGHGKILLKYVLCNKKSFSWNNERILVAWKKLLKKSVLNCYS